MGRPPLAMIWACLHYNKVTHNLILAVKHGDELQLTPFLTSLMVRNFAMLTDGEDSLVVLVDHVMTTGAILFTAEKCLSASEADRFRRLW